MESPYTSYPCSDWVSFLSEYSAPSLIWTELCGHCSVFVQNNWTYGSSGRDKYLYMEIISRLVLNTKSFPVTLITKVHCCSSEQVCWSYPYIDVFLCQLSHKWQNLDYPNSRLWTHFTREGSLLIYYLSCMNAYDIISVYSIIR